MRVPRVELWDAINRYVQSCGGDPSKHVYGNVKRMDIVAEVETAMDKLATDTAPVSVTLEQSEWQCLIQIFGEAVNKAFGNFRESESHAYGHSALDVMRKIKQATKLGR